jgi:hypothetical protein
VPKIFWTKETAKLAALKSAQVRFERRQAELNTPEPSVLNSAQTDAQSALLCAGLALACLETLARLRKTSDASERLHLAKALKELRETQLMGKPKPKAERNGNGAKPLTLQNVYPKDYIPEHAQQTTAGTSDQNTPA